MTTKTVYAVLVTEPDVDAYVLGDGSTDLATVQEMMLHRAEELIDEAVEQQAIAMEDPNSKIVNDRELIISQADNKMSCRVYLAPFEGQTEGRDVATFTITAISVEL